jgi:hypothetical protein
MATQHCFTPVKILPVPPVDGGAGVTSYTITTVPAAVPAAVPAVGSVVPYDADQVYVEYVPVADGAPATPIKFFKFAANNSAPKYIAKHNDNYDGAVDDVNITGNKTYLVMLKDGQMLGGSKSSRKGRKSARKGRKSARKSRRARGSRSNK